MSYCDEDDVYMESGMDSAIIQNLDSTLNAAAVTAMVNEMIADAQAMVNDLINVPEPVVQELHTGTGEREDFNLGAFDELGFYDNYTPENNTVRAYACWISGVRRLVPYPTATADQTESIAATCAYVNASGADDTDAGDFEAGANALHVTYTAAGLVRYPSAQNLNVNIDVFEYVSFRVKASSAAVIFTLRLFDRNGNSNNITFSVDQANVWYIVHFSLESDTWTGSGIDWDDINLYYWEIAADAACQIWIDNFNINDGWFFTAPQGKLVIPHMLSEDPIGYGTQVLVNYSVNNFLSSVPYNIKHATAKFAAVALISWAIGRRQRNTAFLVGSDTLVRNIDKETMYHTMGRLNREAREALGSYGYGYEFIPVM